MRLEVAGTGDGIAPADLPHVFEPFYRGRGAHSREGSGLGLAMARSVARAHGGTVQAGHAPGLGALFIVWLPRQQALVPAGRPPG